MSSYLEKWRFTQPDLDSRDAAGQEAAKQNGIPLHDLRAVDMVGKALLNPKWDYRTANGIEQEIFLPIELIASILKSTPSIARKTAWKRTKSKKTDIYAHPDRPKTKREKLEEFRQMLAN